MTILQVAITIAASETPMTFLLAKPEDDDKEKIAELGLGRIKILFACGRDISLESYSRSFSEGIFEPELTAASKKSSE